MTEPTAQQIEKLPKWAREHIRTLERQRDQAAAVLNRFCDEQTPSGIYVEKYDGTSDFKRRYIQARHLTIEHAGVQLGVMLTLDGDSQRGHGIELQWRAHPIRLCSRSIALVPTSFCTAELLSKDNMK